MAERRLHAIHLNTKVRTMYNGIKADFQSFNQLYISQYSFTGLTNNTVYTVSVVAINCAGSSSPATIHVTGKTKVCICMTSNNVNKDDYLMLLKFDIVFAQVRLKVIDR